MNGKPGQHKVLNGVVFQQAARVCEEIVQLARLTGCDLEAPVILRAGPGITIICDPDVPGEQELLLGKRDTGAIEHAGLRPCNAGDMPPKIVQ